jgi:hypothetical protein
MLMLEEEMTVVFGAGNAARTVLLVLVAPALAALGRMRATKRIMAAAAFQTLRIFRIILALAR